MWINPLSVFWPRSVQLKFRNKPWITLGLQKSIFIKNHLLTKYIKFQDVNTEK